MRYLCFLKMDEAKANPPRAMIDATTEHDRAATANGTLIVGGDLDSKDHAVEFRVQAGKLTITDGPFAEVKEVIGGWAMLEVESDEQARAEAQALIEMHMANWPEWEGSIELRRIGNDT
jgi:hypothetical protein